MKTPMVQSLSIKYILEQPTELVAHAAVTVVMDTIIIENAFTSSGGNLVAKKGAIVVEPNVQSRLNR